MSRFSMPLGLIIAVLCAGVAPASIFVGSFRVNQGPYWGTNPPAYSGVEAAALIFGGLPTDYRISTISSLDPLTINDSAWYDSYGLHSGLLFPDDFKLDVGAPGYADPGGAGTAYSAYVSDGLNDSFVNYVWTADATDGAVPEPLSIAVWSGLAGIAGVLAVRRRRQAVN